MPDEQPSLADDDKTVEAGILERLTGERDQRPWSVDELIRDVGQRLPAIDAINNLQRIGLIHRCGELVFPTRVALRAAELDLQ